jgi:hypothetical protein
MSRSVILLGDGTECSLVGIREINHSDRRMEHLDPGRALSLDVGRGIVIELAPYAHPVVIQSRAPHPACAEAMRIEHENLDTIRGIYAGLREPDTAY